MILIITNGGDSSTFEVVDWIRFLSSKQVEILCVDNKFELQRFNKREVVLKFDNKTLDLSKVEAYWYRKGDLFINQTLLRHRKYSSMPIMMKTEAYDLHYAIHNSLLNKKKIGNYFKGDLNRIDTLLLAERHGLNIPDFCITSNKGEVAQFLKKHERIVIRSINQGFTYGEGDSQYFLYVNLFTQAHCEKLPERFFPTLFMEYISKSYEIRSFYLNGQFYSMAIFSQGNKNTELDFRQYDKQNPNRNVPYQLPVSVEESLCQLMQKIGLETGSIDLICSENGEYYFLEINPVGQFGMVSKPCNYYLEKAIAKELIK